MKIHAKVWFLDFFFLNKFSRALEKVIHANRFGMYKKHTMSGQNKINVTQKKNYNFFNPKF